MEQVLGQLTVQDGIFALLFVALLVTFLKSNKKMEQRLIETDKFVRDELMQRLQQTSEILSCSTRISEIAVRRLMSQDGGTDSQSIDLATIKEFLQKEKSNKSANKRMEF
jgi:hypothetical protein